MSRFFNYRVGSADPDTAPTFTSWHSVLPVVAAGNNSGQVTFYNDEGVQQDSFRVSENPTFGVSHLSWAPPSIPKALAVGMTDGTVAVWVGSSKKVVSNSDVHGSAITAMLWYAEGRKLLTGDADGTVAVWNYASNLQVGHIYRKEDSGPVTRFLPLPNVTIPGAADDANSFLYGGASGLVYLADDDNHSNLSLRINDSIAALLWDSGRGHVVVLTQSLKMNEVQFSASGKARLVSSAKVSTSRAVANADGGGGGQAEGTEKATAQAIWAGPGLLALAYTEDVVRMFNLYSGENYILNMPTDMSHSDMGDHFRSLAFNSLTRVLAAGTRDGAVAMWRLVGAGSSSKDWSQLPSSDLGTSAIASLEWGPGEHLLVARQKAAFHVLNETILHRRFRHGQAAIQVAPSVVSIQKGDEAPKIVNASLPVKGIDLSESHIVLWSAGHVEVFEIPDQPGASTSSPVGSFESTATTVALHKHSLLLAEKDRVDIASFSGTSKQSLPFSVATEGSPVAMDVLGDFMAVATDKNYVQFWDLSRRQAKAHTMPRSFVPEWPAGNDANVGHDPGSMPRRTIKSIRSNCDGSRLSLHTVCAASPGGMSTSDPAIHVYDVETDSFSSFSWGRAGRTPVSHYWDGQEPKLLAVETQFQSSRSPKELEEREFGIDPTKAAITHVHTLFASAATGVVVQDTFPLDPHLTGFSGLHTPYLFFVTASTGKVDASSSNENSGPNDVTPPTPGKHDHGLQLYKKTMRDFVGLEEADADTLAAMMQFSFNVTIGNMDEAYKSVKLIKSSSVWENMATMCVKTKRLDVAEICLGNMGNARAAAALREAKKEPESDAQVAVVAAQLGLIPEAEALYRSAGRWDLLNKFYQAAGRWSEAIEVAENHDRISVRTTHFSHARHLEAMGHVRAAIAEYEASGTHRFEVPRMLVGSGQIDELEAYVNEVADPELWSWFGQYCESLGAFDKALLFYSQAKDYLAVVRVLCHQGDLEQAAEIASESKSPAASYHLARQYEARDQLPEAIQAFAAAGRYNHAIRLAITQGNDVELMSLALISPPELKEEVAMYFEEAGELEKAITLYHKAGRINKALDISMRAKLYHALDAVVDELSAGSDDADPAVLVQVAEFFVSAGRHDNATLLLVKAGQFDRALDMADTHDVKITEDMAEAMTLPKPADSNSPEAKRRLDLLQRVASVAEDQRSYHLACKKYTQAGDKVKAMKALLRSGDTEKVIFFAGVSRSKDIYILAANYLQTLDWRNDAEVMKVIIGFYTKAKSYDRLSTFYEACSGVEIDEYQSYDKALRALKEALKYSKKAKDSVREAKLADRITHVEKFVAAREAGNSDAAAMIRACSELLEVPDIESSVRVGDIYWTLVDYYVQHEGWETAYQIIERMRTGGLNIQYYLEMDIVEKVYAHVNKPVPLGDMGGADAGAGGITPKVAGVDHNGGGSSHGSDDEEIEEMAGAGTVGYLSD